MRSSSFYFGPKRVARPESFGMLRHSFSWKRRNLGRGKAGVSLEDSTSSPWAPGTNTETLYDCSQLKVQVNRCWEILLGCCLFELSLLVVFSCILNDFSFFVDPLIVKWLPFWPLSIRLSESQSLLLLRPRLSPFLLGGSACFPLCYIKLVETLYLLPPGG